MPYFGEYECKLDSKGRLKLPVQLIRQMQPSHVYEFVIHRGFEKCLMMYEKSVWDKVAGELERLNVYSAKQRDFLRYFFRGASVVTLDAADRMLLSKRLTDFAGIDKDVILTSLGDRLELWAPKEYDLMVQNEPADFSKMAEELFGDRAGEKASDTI